MDSLQARLDEEAQLEAEAAEEERRITRLARKRPRTVELDPAPRPRINAPAPPTIAALDTITPNQAARFWSRVDRSGECWLWQGPPMAHGYGQVGINKRTYRTHRVAYMLAKGPIPRGMVIRHMCHNRLCVRPDHLELGTYEDNTDDLIRSKRGGPGKNAARGERAGASRLSDRDVIAIRTTYATGGVTQGQLARAYEVTPATISRIITGKAWAHLPLIQTSQSSEPHAPKKSRLRRSVYKVAPSRGLAKRMQEADTAS